MSGKIFVISGPSGSGKSTLVKRLLKEESDVYFSISSTTRAPRDGEINGVHYFFIDKNEFENGIKNNEFLEWAVVHDNYYGTSLKPVLNALQNDKIVIFDIDVQGFEIIKNKFKKSDFISLFVTTNDPSTLEQRLKNRETNSDEDINRRLQNAKNEITKAWDYDFILINDELETTYTNFKQIFDLIKQQTRLNFNQIKKNWTN